MKIGIIGAYGRAGSLILKEALDRGIEVTAIVKDASKLTDKTVKIIEKDLLDLKAEDVKDLDVLVNAISAPAGKENLYVDAGRFLTNLLKEVPDTRLIVVSGAGSLFVDEDKKVRLYDTPDFIEAYLPTAKAMGASLIEMEKSEGIKWTHLSPAAFFDPQGKRTGKYIEGKDNVIVNSKGESYLSYPDLAVALVDEIENGKHINERFTVVSEKE